MADAVSVTPAPACALCGQRMQQKGAKSRGAAATTTTTTINLGTKETELYYRRHQAPCLKLTSRKNPMNHWVSSATRSEFSQIIRVLIYLLLISFFKALIL